MNEQEPLKKSKLTIAWDVDDTLIIPPVATGLPVDTPNYDIINLLRWFQAQGHTVIVWSGGGCDYAQMWATKLGLKDVLIRPKKKDLAIDIAFDDCDVDLAVVNVKIAEKRLSDLTPIRR